MPNAATNPVTEAEIDAITVAPRVTMDDVTNSIAHVYYFTAGDGIWGSRGRSGDQVEYDSQLDLLTICTLVLRNGFVITG